MRDRTLDSFKGIAIVGIVLLHVLIPYSQLGPIQMFTERCMRVQLFFIISSYLAFQSFGKYYEVKRNTIGWIIKKIVKLMPLYYLSILVSYIFFQKVSLVDLFLHILFLHGFSISYANSINITWYIGTLVIFYFLVPLLYRYLNNLKKSLCVCIFSIIGCDIFTSVMYMLQKDQDWTAYWGTYSIPTQLPVFLMGISLFHLKRENKDFFVKNKSKCSYVLLILATYMIGIGIFARNWKLGRSNIYIWAVLLSICVLSQWMHQCPMLVNRLWAFIGKYSYGIYLSHLLIKEVVKGYIWNSISDTLVQMVVMFVVVFVLSLIISIIATKIIEEPFVNWVNSISDRKCKETQ